MRRRRKRPLRPDLPAAFGSCIVATVSTWKSLCLFLLALVSALVPGARAQAVPGLFGDDPPPPRPAFNVQDNAGLFARDPDRLREISDRLRLLDQRHGFHVYVVVESAVMGSSAIELAARLQQAWLPDGDGFVIVFESDTRSFGLGRNYDVSDADDAESRTDVPSFYAADALERIRSQLDPKLEPAELIDQLTLLLASDVGGYLDRRHAPEPGGQTLRLVLAAVGVLSALGLIGLGIARLAQEAERRRKRSFRFPPASGEQRLGAPFGAKVSSRRFGAAPDSVKS